MSRSLSKQEAQQRSILQADKLLTHACENRKMLLEYDQEIMPYGLRNILKKSNIDRDHAEAQLNLILNWKGTRDAAEVDNAARFVRVHEDFTESSDKLSAISLQLNKALTMDSELTQ